MFTVCSRKLAQTFVRLTLDSSSNQTCTTIESLPKLSRLVCGNDHHFHTLVRHKSRRNQKQPPGTDSSESRTAEESALDDRIVDKHTKLMEVNLKSTRVDAVLKAGLGIARNKIETLFYESKIRVNGQKLLKKSELAREGDEIDVIKGVSVNNPNFLTVARVEVLGIKEKGDNVLMKIRRFKSLTVENYDNNAEKTM